MAGAANHNADMTREFVERNTAEPGNPSWGPAPRGARQREAGPDAASRRNGQTEYCVLWPGQTHEPLRRQEPEVPSSGRKFAAAERDSLTRDRRDMARYLARQAAAGAAVELADSAVLVEVGPQPLGEVHLPADPSDLGAHHGLGAAHAFASRGGCELGGDLAAGCEHRRAERRPGVHLHLQARPSVSLSGSGGDLGQEDRLADPTSSDDQQPRRGATIFGADRHGFVGRVQDLVAPGEQCRGLIASRGERARTAADRLLRGLFRRIPDVLVPTGQAPLSARAAVQARSGAGPGSFSSAASLSRSIPHNPKDACRSIQQIHPSDDGRRLGD